MATGVLFGKERGKNVPKIMLGKRRERERRWGEGEKLYEPREKL